MKKFVLLLVVLLHTLIYSQTIESELIYVASTPSRVNTAQSQYEIQTLLNQARIHESRNQHTQALEIYQSLYEKNPTNELIVESYLRVLYISNDLKTAQTILTSSKGKLNQYFILKQEVIYLIKTNDIKTAEKKANDYLNQNPGVMQYYRELANIFESSALFDIAISIYKKARQVANDPNLYTLELSNAYFYIKNVENFFEESIKFLRLNAGYLYYYRSKFKEFILLENGSLAKFERWIKDSEPEQINELHAFVLVEVKEFQKAISIFEKLPLAKMIKFADDLYTDGYLDFSLEAYQRSRVKSDSPSTLADILMKIATILYNQNKKDESIATLELIINNAEVQRPPFQYRTRANKDSRLLIAQIFIEKDRSIAEVRRWYESASNFSNNQNEKAEILFQLSRYLYLKGDYTQAFKMIESALSGHDPSTNTYKQSYFYRYEIALLQNSDTKDSLLTECMIHFPEDVRISDMLFLETFINSLPAENLPTFLSALRYRGLYQNSSAIQTMMDIAEQSRLDELYLLTYDWIMQENRFQSEPIYEAMMTRIEEHTFRNPVLQDFIFLQKVRKAQTQNERNDQIREFLSNSPQNVFSPQLRYLLYTQRGNT